MANGTTAPGKLLTGKVKWFNDQKGFGFIERDDHEKDVFVHFSGIARASARGQQWRSLTEEDRVEFEVTKDSNGRLTAINVRKVEG